MAPQIAVVGATGGLKVWHPQWLNFHMCHEKTVGIWELNLAEIAP
jgi:hypothetical protein